MPFVRIVPDSYDLVHESNSVALINLIGYDNTTLTSYAAAVSLSRNPTLEYELSFWIVETIGDDAYELWDGRSTKFLRGADRRFALDVIATASKLCVDRLRPAEVLMMTYASELPEKALTKYRRVAQAIRNSGYQVRETESYYGIRLWSFERL